MRVVEKRDLHGADGYAYTLEEAIRSVITDSKEILNNELNQKIEGLRNELARLHNFIDGELEDINDILCNDCVHKLLNKRGYSDKDIQEFTNRTKQMIKDSIDKIKKRTK